MKTSLRRLTRATVRRYLIFIASFIATTKPLRRVPGWWSGYSLTPPLDANRQLRWKLWDALNGQRVRVKWYDGITLELRMGTDISRLVFIGGEIDPNEYSYLAEFLKPGMCVVDVGANEGLFSLFFRKRVGESGRTIAIEPSKRELEHLHRNLFLNSFMDVEVLPLAVGDHIGSATLHVAETGHAGHNALGPPAAPWVSVSHEVEVPLTTLDTLAEQENWPRISLIKMDIEGYELAALRGTERLLRRDHPILLLEAEHESLTLRGSTMPELFSLLAQHGYTIMDFSGEDGSPCPLEQREPVTVNLLAIPSKQ